MKISTILDQIDFGDIALPVFQRGYVWNRDRVRGVGRAHDHAVEFGGQQEQGPPVQLVGELARPLHVQGTVDLPRLVLPGVGADQVDAARDVVAPPA